MTEERVLEFKAKGTWDNAIERERGQSNSGKPLSALEYMGAESMEEKDGRRNWGYNVEDCNHQRRNQT